MKDKDIQNALEKIIELYAEIFADSVMDSKLDARRAAQLLRAFHTSLQGAEDEIN